MYSKRMNPPKVESRPGKFEGDLGGGGDKKKSGDPLWMSKKEIDEWYAVQDYFGEGPQNIEVLSRSGIERQAALAARLDMEENANWLSDERAKAYEDAQAALGEEPKSILETMRGNYAELNAQAENSFTYMSNFSQRTADALEQNFSDLFFSPIEGRFTTLKDYANSVFLSIGRAASDILGQMSKDLLFGKDNNGGGLLSGLWVGIKDLFGPTKAMAEGGTITEPVYGIGKSGKRYIFGEGGEPEDIIPWSKRESSGGSKQITVRNYYSVNISAVDSQSFSDLVARNPKVIAGQLKGALYRGDEELVNLMRSIL